MTTYEVGQVQLRQEVVDKTIKGFAQAAYKFKQCVAISPVTGWTSTYYRETSDPLTEPASNPTKGIPRGAAFPQASVTWTKLSSEMEKYGIEDTIYWEDIISDNIDVQARTMFRVAERVAKEVDDEIFDTLSESQIPTNIGSVLIGAGSEFNGPNPQIIDHLMNAKQLIAEHNYDVSDLMCLMNPRDHRATVNYLTSKGAQFPQIATDVTNNGRVGNLVGINLVVSNSVPGSFALVVKPRVCGTWRSLHPLSTDVTNDAYKGVRIRSCEVGVTQLTDPTAVVLISGTYNSAYP